MSRKQTPQFDDPHLQKYFEKAAQRAHRSEHFFRRALHVIERFIAAITIWLSLELCALNCTR